MSRSPMFSALLIICCFLLSSTALSAKDKQPFLHILIQQLQQRGHAIIYSDRLVLRSMRALGPSVDLATLERSLTAHGLTLRQQQGFWVISPAEAVPSPRRNTEPASSTRPVLENVIVTGSVHRLPESELASSSYRLLPEEMGKIPSLGSDVMRAMVRMPGISSVGVSAKPRIRGGLQDELLVLQDGVELLEPFHLADYHSAYSAIDYHTIESVDFYTGGFPSRYGNRISGVMDINNEWSRDDYNTDIGASSFSYFVNTRGKFDGERSTQWLFSYRQGDLDDLTDYIDSRSGEPTYQDISLRIKSNVTDAVSLSAGLVASEDDIVFSDLEERASSKIDSYYIWSRAEIQLQPHIKTVLAFSYIDFERRKNQFSEELDEDDEDDESDEGEFQEIPDADKGGFLDHFQQVKRLALRNDYISVGDGRVLELGWQMEYAQSDYRHISEIDRGVVADILGTEREISRRILLDPQGWSGGMYVAAEFELSPGWLIQPSLRWDFQDYTRRGIEGQWSPRIGIAFEPDEQSRLRLALGRFYQPEGLHELQVLDGEEHFFNPQYADHAVFGYEWRSEDLQLTLEAYYKGYRDLKTRYENIFNPFVLLPEMEPDRVRLEPEKAFAKGVDLDLRYQFNEEWQGQFRYSAMAAKDKIAGHWVPRRWSQDQTVNAIVTWQRDRFSASVALVWHSGWRSAAVPVMIAIDTPLTLQSVLNKVELKDYFSIDINVQNSWKLGDSLLKVYLDITNASNRYNLAGIDYDIEELENDEEEVIAYLTEQDREALLSVVPSIGFVWSF